MIETIVTKAMLTAKQMAIAATLLNPSMAVIDVEAYKEDVVCLAANIYHEAGNQDRAGKDAIAYATLNRVYDSRWPDTICEVVYDARMVTSWRGEQVPVRHACQYSWFCDGKSDKIQVRYISGSNAGEPIEINMQVWKESLVAAMHAMVGISEDKTCGATHYWNPELASPDWGYPIVAQIGDHVFALKPE